MKKVLFFAMLIFIVGCSDRKKELEAERDRNLKLRMNYLEKITEKQKDVEGNDNLSNEARKVIKKYEEASLKLETRNKVINDSIELLKQNIRIRLFNKKKKGEPISERLFLFKQ